MTLKKKGKCFALFFVVLSFARFLYFAGLSSILPLMPLVFSPASFFELRLAFGIAVASMVSGFIVLWLYSRSRRFAWQSLGWMTIVPGVLSVFFLFSGSRRLAELYSWFGPVSPIVQEWFDAFVPKAWLIAGMYLIIGVFLVVVGERESK